jgi:two-component system phosphate regulon response regulator OmpR
MSGNRLLIVDDDPAVRRMLVEYLGGHGFEIAEADGGAAMRERLQAQVPDLVLLDLGLPGEDGLSLARYLREHFACGVIMVTGTAGTVDRIVGLEVGADDYIAKPFEPRELLARIKSVLRRIRPAAAAGAPQPGRRVRVGRCEIDLASRRLTDLDGNDVALTAMEFDLLRAFIDHPNQVLTRDRLLNLTRDRDWEPFDRSIDIRITRLRRKIEPDPDSPRVIQTVRGAGYMYVPAASA